MPAFLPILAGLVLEGATTGPLPSPDVNPGPGSLERITTRFDFEESTRLRLELPLGFHRATPMGLDRYTSFGTMRPDDGSPRSGRFAFRFDVDGHSMAARTTTGRIPIRTGIDYEISGWIRTERLRSAHATLAAWLVDEHGSAMPGTLVETGTVEHDGDWTRVSVVVPGLDRTARDLVLECRVIQPGDRAAGAGDSDITGTAWFDDLAVTQLPTVRIDDAAGTGLHRRPGAPMLHLRIDDPATEPIEWSLRIENEHGDAIDHVHGTMGDQPLDTWIEPLLQTNGWYRAVLTARTLGHDPVVRTDHTDFVLLPGTTDTTTVPTIGIEFETAPDERALQLVEALGIGMIDIPAVLDDGTGTLEHPEHRRRLGRFLDRGGRLTCRFDRLPGEWATRHALDPHQIAEFIVLDEPTWGPMIDRSITPFGDAASRWILGGDSPMHDEAGRRLHARLATLAPDAVVLHRDHSSATEPHELLMAWKADTPRCIQPPWRIDDRGRVQPTPAFARLHALLHQLSGRRFAGTVPLGDDGSAWYLEPVDARSAALLLPPGKRSTNTIALGPGPMELHDDVGNVQPLLAAGGVHEVTIDSEQVRCIEGIDDAWIRFQRDLVLEPSDLDARPRRHAHVIEVTNPWAETMDGVLLFKHAPRVELSPIRVPLLLGPGETRRIPVDVVVTGPLPPGPMAVVGHLERRGPAPAHFPVQCRLHVGLPSIELSFREWRTPEGMHVELLATNHGDEPRSIDAGLAGGGLPTTGATRLRIEPGATVAHRFELHGTHEDVDGDPIRVLVAESDATGRVVHAVHWDDEGGNRLTGVVTDP